jgi:hypothetical protein
VPGRRPRCPGTAAIACLIALAPAAAAAQDLVPRAYFPAPVTSNAIVLTYAFAHGDLAVDPTLPVVDAAGTIHTTVASYYHAFGLAGRSANVTGSFPVVFANLSGVISGTERSAHRVGQGDVSLRVAINLAGGPARTAAEFARAERIRALLGASLKVVAPTGQYDPTRLINIGTNRWAFKPEVGYMRRVGGLIIESYAGVWFFTANHDFLAPSPGAPGGSRTQDPIGAFELHVSYDVTPRLWISGDANYWRGGRTSVNGAPPSMLQANSRLGVTGSLPLSRRQSLKISYSDGLVVRLGGNFRVLSAGWQYGWIGRRFR